MRRRKMAGPVKGPKQEFEPWQHVFDGPDQLEYGSYEHGIDCTVKYPIIPSELFRHSRRALKDKLLKSPEDRLEVINEHFATSISEAIVTGRTARILLDDTKIYREGTEHVFTRLKTHVLKVKQDCERHVSAMFESQVKIENEMARLKDAKKQNGAGTGGQDAKTPTQASGA